ncbi:MAG: 3-deoxy-manno-octulosonate cytidylyltransferase [Cetobacterium sp.]
MKFLGVIPARYESTRLPKKPLKDICGYPMIEWVYKRALKSKLDKVIVATDSKEVFDAVKTFGGEVILTDKNHINGTSRIAEVCERVTEYDVVINIQGDEPLIEADMINSLIDIFKAENNLKMATLKHKLINKEDIENPNYVKVVTDKKNYAIYFSRSVIPYPRVENKDIYFKHVGIYGYKREFVLEYSKMESTPLENSESLEQLRVLENGYKIKVLETPYEIIGVDTQAELDKVREYILEKGIEL